MNKYRRGKRLTMIGLCKELEANRYVYPNNRPMHWGWSSSMTFHALSNLVKGGRFYKAINNIKEKS